MNRERFDELLDDLLERELTAEEAGELAAATRGDPALRGELRRHLVLWELWSQQQAPERSAEAFLAACRTRLRAEREKESFVAEVEHRIRAEGNRDASAGCRAGSPDPAASVAPVGAGDPGLQRTSSGAAGSGDPALQRTSLGAAGSGDPALQRQQGHGVFHWWQALQQPSRTLWTAVSVLAIVAVVWLAVPRRAFATVTVQGEAVCTSCALHETHEHLPAIRVQTDGQTAIYYVQSDPMDILRIGDYCMAPVPLVATGRVHTEKGRRVFEAQSVTGVSGKTQPAAKSGEPILFPF